MRDTARELGLRPAGALAMLEARRGFVKDLKKLLGATRIRFENNGLRGKGSDWLRFPSSNLRSLAEKVPADDSYHELFENILSKLTKHNPAAHVVGGALDQVENDIKYEGYINKHNRLLKSRAHLDNMEMPADLDYKSLTALSFEAREKLDRIRPATLGEAGRIDGVRAGDLAVLTVILKKVREAKP
jgi:tRNA uridine 5-carboxymethylaminomethyl modification enzyme